MIQVKEQFLILAVSASIHKKINQKIYRALETLFVRLRPKKDKTLLIKRKSQYHNKLNYKQNKTIKQIINYKMIKKSLKI